jgi:hypothetical protein
MQPLQRPQSPQLTPEQLAAMDHYSLLMARKGADQGMQNRLAPYEHRAYAREAVTDNPLYAPFLAGAIPAYQIKKMITGEGRSQPSMEHVLQGLLGVGEGIAARGQGAYNKLLGLLR